MDPDLPPPPAAPPPAPPAATTRGRRGPLGRLATSLSAYLASVALVLGLLAAALGWLLYTEAGSGWLLSQVPGLRLSGQAGSLLGGLSAQQVELQLPGDGARLRLQDLHVGPPRLRAGEGEVWLRIGLDELRARRIDLWLPGGPSSASEPPASLALPVGLDVAALQVDEFHIDGVDTPLRHLRARIELAGDAGRTHRLDALQLQWDRLRVAGRAQVATTGALDVDAALQLSQPAGAQGEWEAALQLQGPLAAPRLQARLRAQAAPGRPAQTLDARATLQPFAAWPLGELQAEARALDLAALHDAAPRTALDLDATARSDGLDRPAEVALTLDNRDAGRWNEGRLPLRTLRLRGTRPTGGSMPGSRHCSRRSWTRAHPRCGSTAGCRSKAAASAARTASASRCSCAPTSRAASSAAARPCRYRSGWRRGSASGGSSCASCSRRPAARRRA